MKFNFATMTPLHDFRNAISRARRMKVVHKGTVYEEAEVELDQSNVLTITLHDTKPEPKVKRTVKAAAKKTVRKKK